MPSNTILEILGIILCLSQSATFSGLNLAFFSLGRLRLEAEAEKGNPNAIKILEMRKDSNFLLCTILWGNVAANVILTQLSDSALTQFGFWGPFLFSTVAITFFGEIAPQAYFSRHALKVAAFFVPIIKFYQTVFYIIAKPTSKLLDAWIGKEGASFFEEKDIEIILDKHIRETGSEISANEGKGAINFLHLDDKSLDEVSSKVDENTLYQFPQAANDKEELVLPEFGSVEHLNFVKALREHSNKRAILTDTENRPYYVLDTSAFLSRLTGNIATDSTVNLRYFCIRPAFVSNPKQKLDQVLSKFVVEADARDAHTVDRDVILFHKDDEMYILTGTDILGQLLKGIATVEYQK